MLGLDRLRLAGMAAASSLNVALAVAVATGRAAYAAAAAALPALAGAFGALAASPGLLVFAALGLEFVTGSGSLDQGLELPGGVKVFPADLVVAIAVAVWIAGRLAAPPGDRPRRLRTPVLGWPLALFATALVIGQVRGHEAYGASLLGMPLRLAVYAGIAGAMTRLTPRTAYRGIVAVFYTGTVLQAILGAYHLATGTSATAYLDLSTGGTRYLGIAVATYLAGALVLALVSLQLDHSLPWRIIHLVIAGLATFGVTIAFTRAVYLGLAVIVPILLIAFSRVRRAVLPVVPTVLVALVLAALVTSLVAPDLLTTLESRVTPDVATDSSVTWREQAFQTAMVGVDEQPLLGVGFGRESTFYINHMPNLIEGDPHNGYVYLLAGGGALALGSFLILLASYLFDLRRRLRAARPGEEQALVIWAGSTWFIFLLHALVEPILTYPSMIVTIWVLMLLPALVREGDPPRGARASLA